MSNVESVCKNSGEYHHNRRNSKIRGDGNDLCLLKGLKLGEYG